MTSQEGLKTDSLVYRGWRGLTLFRARATVIRSQHVPFSALRIEETWRLWCKFLDDYSRFEHWLKTAELTAASPDSADVLYTSAKEELKKFEVSRLFCSLF